MKRREFNKAICQCAAALTMAGGVWEQALAQAKNKTAGKQPAKTQPHNGKPSAGKTGDGWVVFQSPYGDFTVRFPAQPTVEPPAEEGQGPAYQGETSGHVFRLQGFRSSPLAMGWTDESLADFLSKANGIESWRLLSANVLEYRAQIPRNADTGRARQCLAHMHVYPGVLYLLMAVAEEGRSLDVALARKFLGSFRLVIPAMARGRRQPASRPSPSSQCSDCHGTGRKFCMYCRGTGKTDPALASVEGYRCRFCGGDGYTRCQRCGGRGRI